MPAISPSRLRDDVSRLMTEFGSPDLFSAELAHLLDFYADRTVRPSEFGPPDTLLPAYNVPRPVLRSLEAGLKVYMDFDEQATLLLADRLWEQDWFETKYLAVRMLGLVRAVDPRRIVERLQRWILETSDEGLQGEIAASGAGKDAGAMLDAVERMLDSQDEPQGDAALVGMASLAAHLEDEFLPRLFSLFERVIDDSRTGREALVLGLSRALAKRSPGETAFLLRQRTIASQRPQVGRILRQCMQLFPDRIRQDVAETLKDS